MKSLVKALPVLGVQFLFRRDFNKDDKEIKTFLKELQSFPSLSEHVGYLRESIKRLIEALHEENERRRAFGKPPVSDSSVIYLQELFSITLSASMSLDDVLSLIEQYQNIKFSSDEIYKAFDRVCKEELRKEGANPKQLPDFTYQVVPCIKRIVDINFKRCMAVPEAQV